MVDAFFRISSLTDPIVSVLPCGAEASPPAAIAVSVVSHGHRELVIRLLGQLSVGATSIAELVLTHNLPAAPVPTPPGGWPFRFVEIFNQTPAGFGANHNHALAQCSAEFFCVLNPDIELKDAHIWQQLLRRGREPRVGCAYPILLNADGSRQENEREAVSPLALINRHVLKRPQLRVDWVSAAFWLVRATAWRQVGGFDERYFMYCEDTDFCLRLQLAGWRLARAEVCAAHDASWGSRQIGAHLFWHLRSMMRLWVQPTLRRYLLRRLRPV